MRPNRAAQTVLKYTRSKAKMYEFRVPEEHHIAIPRDPRVLFSLAVAILGDLASAIADEFLPSDPLAELNGGVPEYWDEWDFDTDNLLNFAATFFDAYLNSRLDEDITPEFSLLAAAAYYIGHSVGSATVVIKNIPPPAADIEGGTERLVYAVLANQFDHIDDADVVTNNVLSALRAFFRLEDDAAAVADACENLREQIYENGTARELLYADLASAICALKVRAAARTYLTATSGLGLDAWQPALLRDSFPIELWPAQQKICDAGVLEGRSVVIQMPTSAGKTRATEIIIRSAFLSGRTSLAVIVAPFRSLCHDIRADLAKAFLGEDVTVTEATESYQVDLTFDDDDAATVAPTVLIVTPEKLLYLIRRDSELAAKVGLIIYDEGHQFQGMKRGPTYELLLSTLRMSLKPETQKILISAVIGNADEIASWLIGEPNVVRGDGLLPTTKSLAFATWDKALGQLAYVSPTAPDEQEFFVPRLIEAMEIPLRGKEWSQKYFPDKTKGPEVGLYLGLLAVPSGSVAIFCGRKDTAANLSGRFAELVFDRNLPLSNPIDDSDADEVTRIAALTATHMGEDSGAARAASLGVLTHHGDTPQGLRLCIEHSMKLGLTKFVICTSTLAQGVNFPIKYLLVTATQQGRERILVRDFHNLIGRAGRAGMHTEGSVIFTTPTLYDDRALRRGQYGWSETKRLLDPANAEPCLSGILAIFDDYRQKDPPITMEMRPEWLDLTFADAAAIKHVVDAALAVENNLSTRDFTAFVSERARAIQNIAAYLVSHLSFEDDDAITQVEALAKNTLAYAMASDELKPQLVAVFATIANALRDRADDDLRQLIRVSPLSPAAIASLDEWLKENRPALENAALEGALLSAIGPTILAAVNSKALTALSNQDVALPALIAWCSEATFAEIFRTMSATKVRVGRNNIRVEDVVALCENAFGYDAAMVIASLADLAEPLGGDLYDGLAWLQKSAKYGLATIAAVSFHEAGFADRIVASTLAAEFDEVGDRREARLAVRRDPTLAQQIVSPFPNYFTSVVAEMTS